MNTLFNSKNNKTPNSVSDSEEENCLTNVVSEKAGFLPIVTNWFDRLFISTVIWVALELVWMRFMEHSVPLAVAHVIALGLAVVIVKKG